METASEATYYSRYLTGPCMFPKGTSEPDNLRNNQLAGTRRPSLHYLTLYLTFPFRFHKGSCRNPTLPVNSSNNQFAGARRAYSRYLTGPCMFPKGSCLNPTIPVTTNWPETGGHAYIISHNIAHFHAGFPKELVGTRRFQ